MLPLYTARVTDLKPGDFVVVECGSCGHDGLIHPTDLPMLGLGPDGRIVDLAPRLRCRERDAKGKAVLATEKRSKLTTGDMKTTPPREAAGLQET